MIGKHFSLILLPTLRCNANCEYCFENKASDELTHERLAVLTEKLFEYLDEKQVDELTIYWQGGEVMTLPPQWYERAYRVIEDRSKGFSGSVFHSMQSNMIGYSEAWNPVLSEMFDNNVGSSMDYPNLHRKVLGGSAEDYTRTWMRNIEKAREAGIEVQIIAVPNEGSLEVGAERFYHYFLDELELGGFQINTPFPGGVLNDVKKSLPLDTQALSRFYRELASFWMEHGYDRGVGINPFDQFLQYFLGEETCISCIWRENCTDEFLCIDPRGAVAQCDCWVTSYPQYWFGNIFESKSLANMLERSEVRRRFQARPERVITKTDCLECPYLAICHGGCPIRTHSICGDIFQKDPYCSLYLSLFSHMEGLAAQIAGERALHS